MTRRAFSFAISDPEQVGHLVAAAVVCASARYASVHTIHGAERIERRFATPADWKAVEAELDPTPPGLIEHGSTIRRLLLGAERRSLRLTFQRYDDLEIATPANASAVLDAHLRAIAGAESPR